MPLKERAAKIMHRAVDLALQPIVNDRLVVTGFWRSGTTWVQQQAAHALCAKTVFEPLAPSSGNFWTGRAFAGEHADREMYMPLSFADLQGRAGTIVNAALAGRGHAGFAFFMRQSLSEAFRRNVVSKFTRAGFLLGEMQARNDLRFIHVRRHPGAVYASLKNVGWDWSINDVSLTKMYGEAIADETPEIREVRAVLLAHDETPLRRVGALWALSERAAHLTAKRAAPQRILELSYADLVSRKASLPVALETLGFSLRAEPDFSQISPVTSADRHMADTEERLNGWRQQLSASEKNELRAINFELFPEMADVFWQEEVPALSARA